MEVEEYKFLTYKKYNSLKEDIEAILKKAEDWDYGLKGWQTLETKQDLINAIRNEVLNG